MWSKGLSVSYIFHGIGGGNVAVAAAAACMECSAWNVPNGMFFTAHSAVIDHIIVS